MKNKGRRFLLFVFDINCKINNDIKSRNFPYKIEEFKPSISKLKLLKYIDLRDFLVHLLFFLSTRGKYRVIYVKDGNKIIHYSYIIPKNFRFQFMIHENDLEIGPSFTDESYRGQGIYPYVLTYIIEKFSDNGRRFYMLVGEKNFSSREGIIKAGFIEAGEVYKNILKIYKKGIRQ
jgi:GNAT superfamily N-acetyltransferase